MEKTPLTMRFYWNFDDKGVDFQCLRESSVERRFMERCKGYESFEEYEAEELAEQRLLEIESNLE